MAATLIEEFGSLGRVLAASRSQLLRAVQDDRVARYLTTIAAAMAWALRSEATERPVIDSGGALARYLRFVQGFEQVEVVRILYLDVSKRVLREEIAGRGTVDEAPIYVREIIRRGIELGAAGLIVVHNHPSGEAAPSKGDIALTRRLVEGGRTMGIEVYDHLIVTATGFVSLRAQGLL